MTGRRPGPRRAAARARVDARTSARCPASYPVIATGGRSSRPTTGILYALDMRNGATLWSRALGHLRRRRSPTTTAALYGTDGERVPAGDRCGVRGSLLWGSPSPRTARRWRAAERLSRPLRDGVRRRDRDEAHGRLHDAAGRRRDADGGRRARLLLDALQGRGGPHRATLTLAWRGPERRVHERLRRRRRARSTRGRYYNPNPGRRTTSTTRGPARSSGHFAKGRDARVRRRPRAVRQQRPLTARDLKTQTSGRTFAADGNVHVAPARRGELRVRHHAARQPVRRRPRHGRRGLAHDDLPAAPVGRVNLPGLAVAQGDAARTLRHDPDRLPQRAARRSRARTTTRPGPARPRPADAAPQTTNLQLDATHAGGVNAPEPAPPLKERWRLPRARDNVLVGDGRVFLGDDEARSARSTRRTGATLWTQPGPAASIAYDRGRVFARQHAAARRARRRHRRARCGRCPAPTRAGPPCRHRGRGELYVELSRRGRPATTRRPARGSGATGRQNSYSGRAVDARRSARVGGRRVPPMIARTGRADSASPTTTCARDSIVRRRAVLAGPPAREQRLLRDVRHRQRRAIRSGSTASAAPPAMLGNVAVTGAAATSPRWEFPAWTPRWRFRVPGVPGRDALRRSAADRRPHGLLPQRRRVAPSVRRRDRCARCGRRTGSDTLEDYEDTGTSDGGRRGAAARSRGDGPGRVCVRRRPPDARFTLCLRSSDDNDCARP